MEIKLTENQLLFLQNWSELIGMKPEEIIERIIKKSLEECAKEFLKTVSSSEATDLVTINKRDNNPEK